MHKFPDAKQDLFTLTFKAGVVATNKVFEDADVADVVAYDGLLCGVAKVGCLEEDGRTVESREGDGLFVTFAEYCGVCFDRTVADVFLLRAVDAGVAGVVRPGTLRGGGGAI